MREIRVLVCDQMASVRDTFARIFVLRKDFDVAAKAGSLAELLEGLPGSNADVVLTCIDLPDAQGAEVVRAIRERAPGTKVVAYGADPAVRRSVIEAGASDYLQGASFRLETLADMMHAAVAGPKTLDLTEPAPAEQA